MLFLQLTIKEDSLSFQHSEWLVAIKHQYSNAEVMELDNHSDVYLYQQVLKWILNSEDPLVIHIVSSGTDTQTGNMFRFLQEVLQKRAPLLITFVGAHESMKKYLHVFSDYIELSSIEEAIGRLSAILSDLNS